MDVFLVVINLLGAIGVFLYGMKIMSEGLQKVAGARLKRLLSRVTANRMGGVVTGFTITSLIQSSSATTVMIVGFVNAGLLSLVGAIGVIMGANIGTTVTGWLVALLGFKVKITSFALPVIAVGFGLTFFRGAKPKQWGEVLVGFGLLFLGLALLKGSVPEVGAESLAWVQRLSSHGFLTSLGFVGIGTVLTVILQSSSATMTLTLTMTASGLIPYEAAVAMILGENIGTTATANIAAIGTSVAARRTARAHMLFNLIGTVWALALLKLVLIPVVDVLIPGDPGNIVAGGDGVAQGAAVVTAHLAAFHTLFNVTNTLVLLPFIHQIAGFVTRWVPDRAADSPKRRHVARFISTALVQTPELLLLQVRKEMQRMTHVVSAVFKDALRILSQPDESLGTLVEDTLRRETLVDDLEREITAVLALTARVATSASAAREIGEMALNTHRLERIGDHCEKLVGIAIKNHASDEERMDAKSIADINTLGEIVHRSIENLGDYLVGESTIDVATAIEDEINDTRDQLREHHLERMREEGRPLLPGLWLLDTLHHLEEIGDRTYGVIRRAEATKQL